jgi:hypothetical protein
MRVLLSTYGGRGDVEPLAGLAVRLRALGAEVRVCAPPDCAERLAGVGVPLVPVGQPVRPLLHGARPAAAADVPRLAAELIAAFLDKVAEAAEGCDALVATGLLPAAAGARSAAEKLGIRYVYAAYCPIILPSPHHPPVPFPGRPFPPDVTDNRVLWDLNDQSANALFGDALNTRRASIGLSPVDNVYDYAFTPRDPRTSGRRGRHDPHRRGDGGRDAAARRGQPRKAASVRVNHTGSSSRDPEHENLQPWRPEPTTSTGSTSGGALLVLATRFVMSVHAPCCARRLQATSDRSL